MPSCCSAVTPSSRPISSLTLPFSMRSTVGPGEPHLAAGRGRQRADEEIAESRAGVRAAALPLADHVVALGDEVGRAAELEVRKRLAEVDHEVLHVLAAATRGVQGVLQQDVGGGELVDDLGIPGIAPEFREPASDDGLVVLFLRHDRILRVVVSDTTLGSRDSRRYPPADWYCSVLPDCARLARLMSARTRAVRRAKITRSRRHPRRGRPSTGRAAG